jgi:hypothetical protein
MRNLTAVNGPWGIPVVPGEPIRTTCETFEEMHERRPDLDEAFGPPGSITAKQAAKYFGPTKENEDVPDHP